MKSNTACECPAAGWCQRHGMEKDQAWHRLCRFNPKVFAQWEAGEGPRLADSRATGRLPGTIKPRALPAPEVAVAVICHNYGRFLEDCLESVLRQTVPATEIVVVDDASTDNTREVAAQFADRGVRYERVEYRNVHQTRRHGLEATRAGIVCFLDADDRLSPDYLERGLPLFEDYRVGVVYSDCQMFGNSTTYRSYPSNFNRAELERDNFIHAGSLVRREALEQSGVFELRIDPYLTQGDWFIWKHVLRSHWTARKQPSVYLYRQHGNNWMQTMRRENHNYYLYAGLAQECVTLCIALSGRKEIWPRTVEFLERQTWPPAQIVLELLDTSQDAEFGQAVKAWASQAPFARISYSARPVGSPRLADQDRRQHSTKQAVRQAMAEIYNHFASVVNTEYVWFLEDDVIPPADVCERLMQGFGKDVVSVAAPYRSRYHEGYCVWTNDVAHVNVSQPGQGLQRIGGNGFGCTLVRGSVLKQTVFTSQGHPADYDIAFYSRLRKTGWKARVCWDCECEHIGANTTPSLLGNRLAAPATEHPLARENIQRFLGDCSQIHEANLEIGLSHAASNGNGFTTASAEALILRGIGTGSAWQHDLRSALAAGTRKVVLCLTGSNDPPPGPLVGQLLEEFPGVAVEEQMLTTPTAQATVLFYFQRTPLQGRSNKGRTACDVKVTPCECTAPGWCARHRCEKSRHDFELCRRRKDWFAAFEKGETMLQRPSASPPPLRDDCRHRGEELGTENCPTCRGNIRIKVFACELHERCSLQKALEGTACCARCGDYEAKS